MLVSLYILLVSGVSSVYAARSPHKWDMFVFSQSWPQSACIDGQRKGQTCKIPSQVNYWTIHGLWPDYQNSTHPEYCNHTPFDEEAIKKLEPQLDNYWPMIYFLHHELKSALWRHEWKTHGTCAMSDPETANQELYFSQALKKRQQIDLLEALRRCGIVPSDKQTYIRSNILGCIKKIFKVNVILICMNDKNRVLLLEIRMCLDRSLRLIDCQSDGASVDHRWSKLHIAYPTIHGDDN